MILILAAVFIIIMIIEVPALLKQKSGKDLVIYFILLALAFILVTFQISGIKIPSPIKAMTYVVRDVLHLDYK